MQMRLIDCLANGQRKQLSHDSFSRFSIWIPHLDFQPRIQIRIGNRGNNPHLYIIVQPLFFLVFQRRFRDINFDVIV